MRITLDKTSALDALRNIRKGRVEGLGPQVGRLRRCDLLAPVRPLGRQRWTRTCVSVEFLGLAAPSNMRRLTVAVPTNASRIQARFASCTIYSVGMPPDAFVDVGHGISIASPELLFLEMATILDPTEHLLLGFELTGRYATGGHSTVFDVPPATTVERLRAFIARCSGLAGVRQARDTLHYLSDNAWSPREALIAALARLPVRRLGYAMEGVKLNPRSYSSRELISHGARRSRVPDILLADTPVGINYEGDDHLDLKEVVESASWMALNPGSSAGERRLKATLDKVREKVLDDIRRNRELAAMGQVVTSVTKEDLRMRGGLDSVMLMSICAIERLFGKDMSGSRRAFESAEICEKRQKLVDRLMRV